MVMRTIGKMINSRLSAMPELKIIWKEEDVEQGNFPGPEHSFLIKDDVLKEVLKNR